jgi:hypothetical protein
MGIFNRIEKEQLNLIIRANLLLLVFEASRLFLVMLFTLITFKYGNIFLDFGFSILSVIVYFGFGYLILNSKHLAYPKIHYSLVFSIPFAGFIFYFITLLLPVETESIFALPYNLNMISFSFYWNVINPGAFYIIFVIPIYIITYLLLSAGLFFRKQSLLKSVNLAKTNVS